MECDRERHSGEIRRFMNGREMPRLQHPESFCFRLSGTDTGMRAYERLKGAGRGRGESEDFGGALSIAQVA
jgi:hypothetical protein